MRKVSKFLTVLLCSIPALARAELGTTPVYSPSATGAYGSLVGPGVAGAQSKEGAIPTFDYSQAQATDRKDNLNDVKNRTSASGAAAAAAGASMISTGVPMSMSIIPEVAAAGQTLIAMGTTELIQAASMGGASQNAGNGSNTLKQGGTQGSQLGVNEAAKPTTLSPEANQVLANQGINPQEFIDKLKSGTDPATALGIPAAQALDEEAAKKSKELVDHTLASFGGKGGTEALALIEDSKAPLPSPSESPNPTASSSGSRASNFVPSFGSKSGNSDLGNTNSTAGLESPAGQRKIRATAGDPSGSESDAKSPVGIDGILAKFGFAPSGATTPAAAANLLEARTSIQSQLVQLGVSNSFKGETIFHKASRVYRSYSRWMKDPKVAKNVR